MFNPQFVGIGNSDIIARRSNKQVLVSPNGHLSDYVPFYLGARSKMLFQICTGYNVPKQNQSNIIYLLSSINRILQLNCQYCFTNGNAAANLTRFFSSADIAGFKGLYWDAINAISWTDPPELSQAKQSEVLVFEHFPAEAINEIHVYNTTAQANVLRLVEASRFPHLTVSVTPGIYY